MLILYPFGEHIRFFVLSTHYRRPIEYSAEELESKRKGLHTFYRLFERIERIGGESPYDNAPALNCAPVASAREDSAVQTDARIEFPDSAIDHETLSAACDEHAARFVAAMEDDFNTAGGIASLFDLAAAINRFIEQEKLESGGNDAAKANTLMAARRLIAIGRLIGSGKKIRHYRVGVGRTDNRAGLPHAPDPETRPIARPANRSTASSAVARGSACDRRGCRPGELVCTRSNR